ncbi:hypothetical protein F66182_6547 [Fusarium sp. NRRL 66182]|nr:hypothetical protein F66182_6547 [Fusarium sp. NRRL 66182]
MAFSFQEGVLPGLCPGGLQCLSPADDVVDADMNGIGVVLSFVITAGLSVLVAVTAVVKRGIPKQQYMHIDEKVLYWIGVRKPAQETPHNLGYQAFLLALSDQMLAIGLCYLVAIKADFEDYMEQSEEKRRIKTRKTAEMLERGSGIWKTFSIVAPLILAEVSGSVLFELLVTILTFTIALYTLTIGLFYQGVDTKPLLTASFGQVMPMLLLIVIALTAVEIGSESTT